MAVVTIRHYQNADCSAVCDISSDTAFFGEPVEAFLDDRRLYCDAFARYYVIYETSFVWVAENGDGIIGFLFGCADTAAYSTNWRRYIIIRVLVNAVRGSYRIRRRTLSFAFGMFMGMIRGEEPMVDLVDYPAHLQIDVKLGFRGLGIGRELIIAYLEQIRGLGVGGVHLVTTSHNVVACHLYEKIGFQLLDRRPNRYWTRRLGEQVDNRSYGIKLS